MPRAKVVGGDEATRDLRRVTDRIAEAADLEAKRAGERLVSLVVPKVPRVTGALAGSLGVSTGAGVVEAGYDGSLPYTGYIEFGGSHGRPYVAAGRYLYPTAAAEPGRFRADAEQSATRTIRGYAWSRT